MTEYEKQLDLAKRENVTVIEKYDMEDARFKGLYCNGTIALNKNLATSTERSCILAEELGHHYTTVGDILDQNDMNCRKQELRARLWAYNKKIGLRGIIRAYEAHLTEQNEIADFLDVTPEFLLDALQCYRNKYGSYTSVDHYIVFFEPHLSVMKLI